MLDEATGSPQQEGLTSSTSVTRLGQTLLHQLFTFRGTQTPEEIQCWTRDQRNVSVLRQRKMKNFSAVILLNLFVSASLHNGIFVYFLLFSFLHVCC